MATPNPGELTEKYLEDKKIEFEIGCDQGSAAACFSLGEWHQLVNKDALKAGQIYDENCFERKSANSCFNLAMLYLGNRLVPTPPADATDAIAPLPKKDASVAAENATPPAKQPESVDPTMNIITDRLTRAALLQKRACVLGNGQACSAAAQLMLHGVGCPKDVDGAVKRYDIACERDDAQACFKLGSLLIMGEKYGVKRDPKRAAKLVEKGCDLGHPNACQVMSVMYLKGDGVEKNMKKHEHYKALTIRIVEQTGQRMGAEVVGL